MPANFRFSIKATQRITHIKRLKNCAEETKYLIETASLLRKDSAWCCFSFRRIQKRIWNGCASFCVCAAVNRPSRVRVSS